VEGDSPQEVALSLSSRVVDDSNCVLFSFVCDEEDDDRRGTSSKEDLRDLSPPDGLLLVVEEAALLRADGDGVFLLSSPADKVDAEGSLCFASAFDELEEDWQIPTPQDGGLWELSHLPSWRDDEE
jgi:hypothetical protein